MPLLVQDVRYDLHTLIGTPGFTAIAVAVLALGIGVNATVFSLVNTLFLRPLPVSDPGTVVRVYSKRYSNTPLRSYLEYRARNSTLAGLAAFQMQSFGLRIDADTEHGFGQIVSGDYLANAFQTSREIAAIRAALSFCSWMPRTRITIT